MTDEADRLIEVFFAPPNQLQIKDVANPTTSDGSTGAAGRLLGQLADDARINDGRPVLLPRVDDKGTLWYALLSDRRMSRVIAEDINSFIGATYSDVGVMVEPLDTKDPIDRAVSAWIDSAGQVLRFRVPPDSRRDAMAAIVAMRDVWEKRPRHLTTVGDGTGMMLRALNRAIASGDRALAEQALDRIRVSGRLSSANVAFSTIRVLEVGGRWPEMLDLHEVGVVLGIPRPRGVTEALLRAVYWTRIAGTVPIGESLGSDQIEAALSVMRDAVLPRYATLFRAVEGLGSTETLVLFALRAATAAPPRLEEMQRLADAFEPTEAARSSIDAIADYVRNASNVEAPHSTESPFADESVDAELRRAAEKRKTNIREAQAALEVFGRGGSSETAVAAHKALSHLAPDEVAELASIHRYESVAANVRALVPPGEGAIPNSWAEWSVGLRTSPDWRGAVDLVELAADHWAIEPLLHDEAAENFALAIMEARSLGGRDASANALDHLVPAAESAVSRGLDGTGLASRLVTVILADDNVTEADWNFVTSLLDIALNGIDQARYSEILDELRSTLTDRVSPALIDPALASLEVAAFHVVRDRPALDALAAVVIGVCERFGHRMHRDQIALLGMIGRDLGGDFERQVNAFAKRLDTEPEAQDDPLERSLNGQLIGIYSLEEAAAARAKVAIEATYGNVRVETDSSHVATQGLRRLAQSADQMVLATRAAKHAATTEVESILRKRGVRPIFPAGKGATSILRALRDRASGS